jgi:type I restriction enzyme M protein
LESEHGAQILNWYQDYRDVIGFAKVVTLEEIAQNDYNLNIPRYVEVTKAQTEMSVDQALDQLKTALNEAYSAEDHLLELLRKNGLVE